MTRTRQQSGPAIQSSRPLPTVHSTPSPPPLPVKQIRRSILPGYSGYNSDTENQPAQANKVSGLATPGGRHLRSARIETPSSSSKPNSSSVPLLPMTLTSKTSRHSNVVKAEICSDMQLAKTPENRDIANARVLRSRNTPASAAAAQTKCKSRMTPSIVAARNAMSQNAATSPSKLPETGVKRKRTSQDAGGNVPTLAAKMLKMGQAKTSAWSNPIGKRSAAKAAK